MSNSEKKLKSEKVKLSILSYSNQGYSKAEIAKVLGLKRRTVTDFLNKDSWKGWWDSYAASKAKGERLQGVSSPRILFLDIETAPILADCWTLWDNNVGLNQIRRDWYILSWAAKWIGEDSVMYVDKSKTWQDEDDSELLKPVWDLLDEADIVVTQNGIRFDIKKLNARFILNGMRKPSPFRQIDTLAIAKREFGFTSNKLEYMTDKLCVKYKKLKHANFSGHELWAECIKGNPLAWDEMREYNIHDILSLEELYMVLRGWDRKHPNLATYSGEELHACGTCGSESLVSDGYHLTNLSKFKRWRCTDCNAYTRDRVNLLPKTKRVTLKGNIA